MEQTLFYKWYVTATPRRKFLTEHKKYETGSRHSWIIVVVGVFY